MVDDPVVVSGLSHALVGEGYSLILKLEEVGWQFYAALWVLNSEGLRWELVLAPERDDATTTQDLVREVRKALRSMNRQELTPDDVFLVSKTDWRVRHLPSRPEWNTPPHYRGVYAGKWRRGRSSTTHDACIYRFPSAE